MKYFLDRLIEFLKGTAFRRTLLVVVLVLSLFTLGWMAVEWKNVESSSTIEAALYRLMPMPMAKVMGLRPPKEAVPLLGDLIQKQPTAELYSLRAMNEEASLDFSAAESDWKKYVELSPDPGTSQFAVADFYHRRLRPTDEISALNAIARTPAPSSEKLASATQQSSWQAFERIFTVIQQNALPANVSVDTYKAWIVRFPEQKSVYARYFQFLLDQKAFSDAEHLIADYQKVFPSDDIFPVKARALLAYKKGSVEQGLAVYDSHFQPLWPQELVQSYFDLLNLTHSTRKFIDNARAAIEKNPDDYSAAARIFYYYQRQGRTDLSQQTLNEYRMRKDQRGGKWSSDELYTFARLNEIIHSYPEAPRYYYGLYNATDKPDSPEIALAGLANLLMESPEQGIRLGSGELSMYKDIATMDQGPGLLNGVLSLILNSTGPQYAFPEEEQRAVPYFHRAKATELVRLLDKRFPNSARRAELHARLVETYSVYGEDEVVIRGGREFLAEFRNAPQREQVALLLADAYARTNRSADEFALYDSLLTELARSADSVPLGAGYEHAPYVPPAQTSQDDEAVGNEDSEGEDGAAPQQAKPEDQRAFSVATPTTPEPTSPVRSPEYARVLERYLSRLVSLNQVPQALAVLRKEIDRNPNDPGLYERLAQFLQQNQLGRQQEEVYKRAIQQFQDRSWYHKLARFYLREKRQADFQQLTVQVTRIFSGTDLEDYFNDVVSGSDYYTRLNEYAHQRFPHDLRFVRNLLNAYYFRQPAKWEALLREHWWESEELRNRFFEFLSSSGKLDQELAMLNQIEPAAKDSRWTDLAKGNPVAARFVGEAGLWQSHFEQAAPVIGALANQYPADAELGHRAASLFRSLAAFDPKNTEVAVNIEENLYKANPGDRDQLARIGDILSDRELFDRAAPYWDRMATIRPGEAQAYLDPATVYWDYYDFGAALKLLNAGRQKLGNPSLYSYEEGAIYENQRMYPQAVTEYLAGALREGENSQSQSRLLQLAPRKNLRDTVDQATANIAYGSAPDLGAVKLRLAVLDAQNRPKDAEQFLSSLTARSTSLELLDWLQETARQRSLVAVQQSVLERQATLTTDPVRRLELRYALVQFYENKKDLDAAQRNVEALYRENPKILGVVRSTVDFYWRNKQKQKALDVLQQAISDSYPGLKTQFKFETARKATDAAQYDLARRLLKDLLADSPYNGEYLSAMADTYARAEDDSGLRAFYLEKIEAFRKAPLSQDERNRQIATLRRGLIPALTRLKDYAGAVDQYIEIINRYPEDEGLVSEAALYAQRYSRQQQLLEFYAKTIQQSPRDYRWPMVLARTQTQLEDFPGAIDSYARAIQIRPDRVDLRTARAELLERLMRFDDAAADYQRLYDLNYHDTRWMENVATIRARQGRVQDAVAALQVALVDNRPEKPANYFEVARRLESWGMLDKARDYAQKGVNTAGRDLLASTENQSGALLYTRILTRLRQQDEAYKRLQEAVNDANSLTASVNVAVSQVEKNGLASVTDAEWRDRALRNRRAVARAGMASALREMGTTVAKYFTPEEKLSFSNGLQAKAANAAEADLAAFFVEAARSAELSDLESRWDDRLMLSHYGGNNGYSYKARLVDLQTRRLKFQELGAQLERYAQTLEPKEGRDGVLLEAANAYRSGADYDQELVLLREVARRMGPEQEQRYFALLLEKHPDELVQLAGSAPESMAIAATQYAVAHGSSKLAQDAVAARGKSQVPVWTKAYSAITGLYYADRSPTIKMSFTDALGDATIGERLGKPVDRTQQLAGSVWFYYGSRYGEWTGIANAGDPEDFLPALLEQSPYTASGYVSVAEYYSDSGKFDRAISDYNHVLELSPVRPEIHDKLALIYWRQKKRDEAIAEWKQGLEMLDVQVNQRGVPPGFWSNLGYTLNHLGNRKLLPELRPQADAVLRDYVKHNGTYQADGILKAAFIATNDPQAGVAWLIDLSSVAPDPTSLLQELANANWIPAAARDPLYQQVLSHLQDRARTREGAALEYVEQDLRNWQVQYARYLIDLKQFDAAANVLQSAKSEHPGADELELWFRVALERNEFDSILGQYRAAPEKAPAGDVLRVVARALQTANQRVAARKIFEFVFSREIANHQLSSSNMLGLAEIRLQDGDTAGAMELLHRLTLVIGRPFENLDPAATLLIRTGHHAEAVEFLTQEVRAVPWDTSARLKLAQEQIAAGQSPDAARNDAMTVASNPQAAYSDRVEAAMLLKAAPVPGLGSAELNLVANNAWAPAESDKPFFYIARVRAAEKASAEQREALLRNALADAPDSSAARLPLFTTYHNAGKDQLAISTIKPLLNLGFLELSYENRSATSTGEADEDSAETEEVSSAEPEETPIRPDNQLDKLTPSQRVSLAMAVGRSFQKLDDLQEALRYYRNAASLDKAKTFRAEIDRDIRNVNAVIRRNANNEQRMPAIHNELEQDHVVRPRLVAAVRKPAAPASKKGVQSR